MNRGVSLSERDLKTKDACSVPHGVLYGCTLSGAFAVLNQILDGVCVVHGPIGCTHLNLANHWGASLIRQCVGVSEAYLRSYPPFADNLSSDSPSRPVPSDKLALCERCKIPLNHPLQKGDLGGLTSRVASFSRVISTNLRETEVIFGGEETLRKALYDAERRFHPSLITIVSSCVAGVIGDHVEGVVQELEGKVREKILFAETDGFVSGGFDLGVNLAYSTLIERLVEPSRTRDSDLVNILGEKALASEVEINFREIERLLDPLGVRVGLRFIRHATVEGIQRMTEASLNLISSRETGLYPARLLQEKFEMPFLEADFPVGRRETADWLRRLGRLLGREDTAEELARQEEGIFLERLDRFKKVLAGKRLVINTVDRQIDWIVDLACTLEMDVAQINIFQPLRKVDAGYCPRNLGPIDPSIPVRPVGRAEEIRAELERLRPDLCLGIYRLSFEMEGMAFLSIPLVPAVGYSGGLEMATRWYRILKNPRREGWLANSGSWS